MCHQMDSSNSFASEDAAVQVIGSQNLFNLIETR